MCISWYTNEIKLIRYHNLMAFPADITVKSNHTGRPVSHGQKFNHFPSYSEGPRLKPRNEDRHILWNFVTVLSTSTKMER